MNKLQPCGMVWWCGCWKKKDTRTHTTHTPVPSHCLSSSLFSPQCTHMLHHKAPSVLGLSVHQLMQSSGLGVLIITLLNGGLTKAHSHHIHIYTCTRSSQLTETAWCSQSCRTDKMYGDTGGGQPDSYRGTLTCRQIGHKAILQI